ncbi:MAG: SDR family NAD(P)-dependent oxidoreductase [Deltaproteobacteria bacterium]|nr:SDR family NAD(P)-dependent oxidoreductase [Deltaproteobacteria bacterium]
MKTFRDRVAVVTGGASGIGRALAERFAADGMKVVLADVEEGPLAATAREMTAAGATVLAVRTDVAKAADVEALAERAWSAYGAVHVLCNNAGVGGGGLSWECSLAEWEWVLGVNLWGVIHGVRAFVPRMLAGGDEGHVVNTASVAGLSTAPGMGSYNVSKFGVVALSEVMHHEFTLLGAKLRVSVLCPAWVNTRIADADRNRPVEAAANGAANPAFEAMRDAVRNAVAAGLPPARVAEMVLDAIRDERFYVLTHPDFVPVVRHRMEGLLEGRNPSFGGFGR